MDLSQVRFAHFTDIHLPIPGGRPRAVSLMSKRLLGYLSWSRRRVDLHKREAIDRLVTDFHRQETDAALITGDIVNIALPGEFKVAKAWVDKAFADTPVFFTPGNHDTYVKTNWDDTLGLMAPYMAGARVGDEQDRPARDRADFPYLRTLGDDQEVAVIGINSAPSTAPGLALGWVGDEQIDRVRALLREAGRRQQFRIAILHHPLLDDVVPPRKALKDRAALREAMSEAGVELVLHGHAHFVDYGALETVDGTAPVICGGSASHPEGRGKYRPARYNLFTLLRQRDGSQRLVLEARELDPASGDIVTAETRDYDFAARRQPAAGAA